MNPTRFVRTIALLYMVHGVYSLIAIVIRTFELQEPAPNFEFLFVWLGLELFAQRETARKCAIFFAALTFLSGSAGLVRSINGEQLPYDLFGYPAGFIPHPWQFVVTGLMVALSVAAIAGLTRLSVKNLFTSGNRTPRQLAAVPLFIAGAAIVIVPVTSYAKRTSSTCSNTGTDLIHVDIRDSISNERIGSDARVSVRVDSARSVSETVFTTNGPERAVVLGPGRYIVTVTKEGYKPWVRYRVLVRREHCELQRVEMIAKLQRSS